MPVFRDRAELYAVLDAFFGRLMARPDIADALVAGRFVLRFRYREPEGQVTIDLRDKPVRWVFGDTDLSPDLELIQSGDVANDFWLGRLNVPAAIATRRVVARGPVSKALALLPAVKPAFPIYAATLRDLGLGRLVPEARPSRGSLARMLDRARGSWRRRRPEREPETHPPLPLVPGDGALPATRFRLDAAPPTDERALRIEMLRRMLLVRAFEEKLAEANARGEVPTEAIHLSIGQEAVAVGACFALRVDDLMATTHRGHGHMLAKGADVDGMMAEIFAKATGLCGGKGGSMHVTDASVGAIGANGIVGASALLAAGAAHSAVRRGSGQVAVAFLGDGATNQGMFHEAANFAAVLALPVVFVVENNLYGEFTPLERHTRVPRLSDRAAAYGMPGCSVDGNDVLAVRDAVRDATARARRGEGPSLVEARTYRWRGHMEGEPTGYRSDEELRTWKEKCPIRRWRTALASTGELTDVEASALEQGACERVEAAYTRALAAPEPELAAIPLDVFAPDPATLWQPPARPEPPGAREITYARAVHEALAAAMTRDERVYLLGEDVAAGGYFAVTAGLVERFGRERVVDTPISEYAIVGSAVGAAMTGMRPVAEILFSDFLTTCMDPLVNNAAKLRYMSGGQYAMPLVVRTPGGAGLGMAAQHSQSLEAWLTGIPGLIIVAPATPYDAKGLLAAAIRSNNPVVFFENKLLYAATGPVPEGDYLVPLGVADVKRAGRDVTVVTVGAALARAMQAAGELAAEGIEAEVIDVRTLVPLDVATLLRSVRRTGRLVTVEDGALGHGFGSEIVARVTEAAFGSLRCAPRRVGALDVPIPYSSKLENAVVPDAARVVEAVRATVRRRAWA
jgi:pyruvate/2-oxoglutarate/acetoin dehydrogenase E1 component/TPP-dependent pyruvate/acetoin dehydrogenase alpha subunit